jgi:hypothetical protein
MQNLSLRHAGQPSAEPAVALLLADDDAGISRISRPCTEPLTRGRLDINMARVGGIDAAIVFRGLLPQLRLALYSGDAGMHRERAEYLCARCGYGICRSDPPRRCPMCQRGNSWLRTSWHPIAELT